MIRYRVYEKGIDTKSDGSKIKWVQAIPEVFDTKNDAVEFCRAYNIKDYRIQAFHIYHGYSVTYTLDKQYNYKLEKVVYTGNNYSHGGNKLFDILNKHKDITVYIYSVKKLTRKMVVLEAEKMVAEYVDKLRKEDERL